MNEEILLGDDVKNISSVCCEKYQNGKRVRLTSKQGLRYYMDIDEFNKVMKSLAFAVEVKNQTKHLTLVSNICYTCGTHTELEKKRRFSYEKTDGVRG